MELEGSWLLIAPCLRSWLFQWLIVKKNRHSSSKTESYSITPLLSHSPRLASNSWSSCRKFHNAVITDVRYCGPHIWVPPTFHLSPDAPVTRWLSTHSVADSGFELPTSPSRVLVSQASTGLTRISETGQSTVIFHTRWPDFFLKVLSESGKTFNPWLILFWLSLHQAIYSHFLDGCLIPDAL